MARMKKKRARDEVVADLLRTDENFRRLYEKVLELNGGRIPSSEEIDRHVQDWRDRRAAERRASS
jgi:hypothetical protein